ncbi:MAG: peptidoglycan-binding domain-containing protein [bacterium]
MEVPKKSDYLNKINLQNKYKNIDTGPNIPLIVVIVSLVLFLAFFAQIFYWFYVVSSKPYEYTTPVVGEVTNEWKVSDFKKEITATTTHISAEDAESLLKTNTNWPWIGVEIQGVILFNNINPGGVSNDPTRDTSFRIDKKHKITYISNYHWNNAQGAFPGYIGLKDKDGNILGSWNSVGQDGQGGAQNVVWEAMPNIILEPGVYTITDSSPETWSRNDMSKNRGFSFVKGIAIGENNTCFILDGDLRYLSKDEGGVNDVKILQDFLKNEGYFDFVPDGFYGLSTVNAVKEFQKNYNFKQSGIADEKTRAKIEEMSCFSNYEEN